MYISLNNNQEVFINSDIERFNIDWYLQWIKQYLNRDRVTPTYNSPPPKFTETDSEKYYKVLTAITDNEGDTFYICTVGEPPQSGEFKNYRYIILDNGNVSEHNATAYQENKSENAQAAVEYERQKALQPDFMDNLASIFGDLTLLVIIAAGVLILFNLGKIKAAAKAAT